MWKIIWDGIWQGLNSPIGLLAVGAIVHWALGLLWKRRPGWKQYEANVIAAVRLAENTIPDDTPNRTARVIDHALKYILEVHEVAKKRASKPGEIDQLRAVVTHATALAKKSA